jgi:hypothetical protein
MATTIPGLGLGHPIIYVDPDGRQHAAIISDIIDAEHGRVTLHQFSTLNEKRPVSIVRDVAIDISAAPVPNSWHWPPRNV